MAKALSVGVVSSADEFDALERDWRALHDAAGRSVFQSFEWNRTWWRHFGARNILHILTVSGPSGIVAIAPLYRETPRVLWIAPMRTLRWIGGDMADYQDVLAATGYEAEACAAIAAALLDDAPADLLLLNDTPEDGHGAGVLQERLRASGFVGEATRNVRCPRLHLKPTWKEVLGGMRPSHAKRIAYMERNMRRNFQVELQHAKLETLEHDFSLFVEMHQKKWVAKGKPGLLGNPLKRAFYRDVARAFAERGWLALVFLALNGERVWVNFSFKRNGIIEFYLGGSAEKDSVRKYSPGLMLNVLHIQSLINEGGVVYDFLRGNEPYKYDLGAVDRCNVALTLRRPDRPVAVALHLAHRAQGKAERLAQRTLAHARKVLDRVAKPSASTSNQIPALKVLGV